LSEPYSTPVERRAIADAVSELEHTQVSDLMRLLADIQLPHGCERSSSG